jgi:hypothetical protein
MVARTAAMLNKVNLRGLMNRPDDVRDRPGIPL